MNSLKELIQLINIHIISASSRTVCIRQSEHVGKHPWSVIRLMFKANNFPSVSTYNCNNIYPFESLAISSNID